MRERGDAHAVQPDVFFRRDMQIHVLINAGAGIPAVVVVKRGVDFDLEYIVFSVKNEIFDSHGIRDVAKGFIQQFVSV